jgi:glycosyltransferase involved in cell wall biosynthesis
MKKKIGILIPKLTDGGAERVASILSLNLSKDYRCFVMVYDTSHMDYGCGGTLIDLKIKDSKSNVGKLANFIRKIYGVRKIKKLYGIETTISLLTGPNLVNIFSRTRDRVIISVRNYMSESLRGFYGKINRVALRLSYNRADVIIAVSNAIREDLIAKFGINRSKIVVIYNPYDIEMIQKMAREEIETCYSGIFSNPVIISSGRLTYQKGYWHLIRAFQKVREAIPQIKLVILGRGNMETKLRNLIESLNMTEDVYLLGYINNPFKLIARSKIYVLSSLYEGFPNAMVEAMACGLPVIATDCLSGPREILAPGTDINMNTCMFEHGEYGEYGILVPKCDGVFNGIDEAITEEEEKLAESIICLYKSRSLQSRYSILAQERAAHFSAEKIISEYERLLN